MSISSQHNQPQDHPIPPMPDNLKTKEQRLLAELPPPGVFIKPDKPKKRLGRPKKEIPNIRKYNYWNPLTYQSIEEEADGFGISTSEYIETLCVYARNVLKISKKVNRKTKKKNDKNGS